MSPYETLFDLKGSFKTTFTPPIVPVKALRTCCPAFELISSAACSAPRRGKSAKLVLAAMTRISVVEPKSASDSRLSGP